MTRDFSRAVLFAKGQETMAKFCDVNDLPVLMVCESDDPVQFGVCAYYRPNPFRVVIHVPSCAKVGHGGPAWSWPGYVVDRTPFGVLQHELGHHVDYVLTERYTSVDRTATGDPRYTRRNWRGDLSVRTRRQTQEAALTGYAPDDGEWWAEMFRLFVTNPNLLKDLRPKTYAVFTRLGLIPVETRSWRKVLWHAPRRTIEQAKKKINEGGSPDG